jgi:apolipoprotein N-acyltransferase
MTAAAPVRRPGLWLSGALSLASGAISVLGFAPLGWFPLPVLAFAVLAWLVARAASARAAALVGFAFGLGLFVFGVGWVYVALNQFGGMPFWLAGPATLLFAAFLSLYPAVACTVTFFAPKTWRVLVFPAAWVLTEWLRGWIFTGFPWLALGYSQVPNSPLGGIAPLAGVFGVSLGVTLVGSAMASVVLDQQRWRAGFVAVVALATGTISGMTSWTRPVGEGVTVALVQGNVAQDLKFREDVLLRTLVAYENAVSQATARLVILPETALPLFLHDLPPDYFERLRSVTAERGADTIAGVFENDPLGSDRYFNSVLSLGASPTQRYRKHHLVPFGEFIPLKALLAPIINDWLHIPLSDQTRGDAVQTPLSVAGQKVAMNICYEDVFGEEIIRQLPDATILANVSNDAWYGRSWAAEQHLQISQMRARETGRWMLRATNTGMTAAIDETGRVLASLPQFTEGILTIKAQGRTGSTPYVEFGNGPVMVLSGLVVAIGLALRRRSDMASS